MAFIKFSDHFGPKGGRPSLAWLSGLLWSFMDISCLTTFYLFLGDLGNIDSTFFTAFVNILIPLYAGEVEVFRVSFLGSVVLLLPFPVFLISSIFAILFPLHLSGSFFSQFLSQILFFESLTIAFLPFCICHRYG